jgi:hypothetical protein
VAAEASHVRVAAKTHLESRVYNIHNERFGQVIDFTCDIQFQTTPERN